MRILVLDLSLTSTGWALMEGERYTAANITLLARGSLGLDKRIQDHDGGVYPWSYVDAAWQLSAKVERLVKEHLPDTIVIEETNGARQRFVQKALEFMHFAVLVPLLELNQIEYVSTKDWRDTIGIRMSKEDKRLNAALRRAQKAGRLAAERKKRGVRGRVNKKHLALRWVKERYGLDLAVNENDQAEAICIGVAWFQGAPISTGDLSTMKRSKETSTT